MKYTTNECFRIITDMDFNGSLDSIGGSLYIWARLNYLPSVNN